MNSNEQHQTASNGHINLSLWLYRGVVCFCIFLFPGGKQGVLLIGCLNGVHWMSLYLHPHRAFRWASDGWSSTVVRSEIWTVLLIVWWCSEIKATFHSGRVLRDCAIILWSSQCGQQSGSEIPSPNHLPHTSWQLAIIHSMRMKLFRRGSFAVFGIESLDKQKS